MSATRMLVDLKKWNTSRYLALPCMLLVLFATAQLRAQSYHELLDFNCPTGCAPADFGHLVQGTDGYLYGTNERGGPLDHGGIFKVDPTGTTYIDLYDLNGTTDGYEPVGALTLASADGNYYGTTIGGGTFNNGTLFKFDASTNTFTVLHNFSSTEGSPLVAPTEGKDQNLYGTTQPGATYRFSVGKQLYQALPNLAPNIANSPLLLASDGNLYGTSQQGGTNDLGTIYRMTTSGKIQIIHNFDGTDGAFPVGGLVQSKSGVLYGTTSIEGGAEDAGTVFQLTLSPLSLTTLHFFAETDGKSPSAGLLIDTYGNLYGTTTYGGANLIGTIFWITPQGFAKLYDFADPLEAGAPGAYPMATLMQHTNGNIYGVTNAGGSRLDGVFYDLIPPGVKSNITLCCNYWVILDQPVIILGQGLTGVTNVSFDGVSALFTPGSDTFLTAFVPSGAIDGTVSVTLASGKHLVTPQKARILPKIGTLDPLSGSVGTQVTITGGGFNRTSAVSFGGVSAGNFTVIDPSTIKVNVPAGAQTGKVAVLTHNGNTVSSQTFTVN